MYMCALPVTVLVGLHALQAVKGLDGGFHGPILALAGAVFNA
jgi:hypothetical protein